jgi:hypothetical protein
MSVARRRVQHIVNLVYRVFENLEAKFSGDNVQPMTEDAAQAWSRELITPKRSVRTVRDIWVNAATTVHVWAKREPLIDSKVGSPINSLEWTSSLSTNSVICPSASLAASSYSTSLAGSASARLSSSPPTWPSVNGQACLATPR